VNHKITRETRLADLIPQLKEKLIGLYGAEELEPEKIGSETSI
jgi:hypothetical protein